MQPTRVKPGFCTVVGVFAVVHTTKTAQFSVPMPFLNANPSSPKGDRHQDGNSMSKGLLKDIGKKRKGWGTIVF